MDMVLPIPRFILGQFGHFTPTQWTWSCPFQGSKWASLAVQPLRSGHGPADSKVHNGPGWPFNLCAIHMVLAIPNFIICQIRYCTLKYEVQKGYFLPVQWGPTTREESSFRKGKDPPKRGCQKVSGQSRHVRTHVLTCKNIES